MKSKGQSAVVKSRHRLFYMLQAVKGSCRWYQTALVRSGTVISLDLLT